MSPRNIYTRKSGKANADDAETAQPREGEKEQRIENQRRRRFAPRKPAQRTEGLVQQPARHARQDAHEKDVYLIRPVHLPSPRLPEYPGFEALAAVAHAADVPRGRKGAARLWKNP